MVILPCHQKKEEKTDNVGKRPDDPVDARRWNNKYGGKYDPETGDRLPEKEKKVPPRMEQNR